MSDERSNQMSIHNSNTHKKVNPEIIRAYSDVDYIIDHIFYFMVPQRFRRHFRRE